MGNTAKEAVLPPIAYAQEAPIEVPLVEEKKDDCPDNLIRCNCYLFVKSIIPNLPLTNFLVPNLLGPIGGSVAIFDYDGTPHYGITTGIMQTSTTTLVQVDECNYKKGKCGKRWIDIYTDRALKGFRMIYN